MSRDQVNIDQVKKNGSGENSEEIVKTEALAIGDTIISDMVVKLKKSANLTEDQSNTIATSAREELNLNVNTLSISANLYLLLAADGAKEEIDLNALALHLASTSVITGSMKALNKSKVKLGEASAKALVTKNIVSSTFSSLKSHTSELDNEKFANLTEDMVGSAVKQLTVAGIVKEDAALATKAITAGAMGALENAGVKKEFMSEVARSVIKGTIVNLPSETLESEFVAEVIGQATQGAIGALTELNLDSESQISLLGELASSSVGSMESLSLPKERLLASVEGISKSAVSALDEAQIKQDSMRHAVKSITSSMVKSLDKVGFNTDELKKSAGAVASGAITGMKDSGMNEEQLAESGMISDVMSGTIENLDQIGFKPSEVASAMQDVMGGAIASLSKSGISSKRLKDAAIEEMIYGAMNSFEKAGINEVSEVAIAMKHMSEGAANALPDAGYQSEELGSAVEFVTEHSIKHIDNIGVKEPHDLQTLAGEVSKGAMSGFGSLQKRGVIQEAELKTSATRITDGAMNALTSFNEDKLLSNEDFGTFSTEVADGVMEGLSYTGGSKEQIAEIKDEISLDIRDDLSALGVEETTLDQITYNIDAKSEEYEQVAETFAQQDFKLCSDSFSDKLSDAEFISRLGDFSGPVLCKTDSTRCPIFREKDGKEFNWHLSPHQEQLCELIQITHTENLLVKESRYPLCSEAFSDGDHDEQFFQSLQGLLDPVLCRTQSDTLICPQPRESDLMKVKWSISDYKLDIDAPEFRLCKLYRHYFEATTTNYPDSNINDTNTTLIDPNTTTESPATTIDESESVINEPDTTSDSPTTTTDSPDTNTSSQEDTNINDGTQTSTNSMNPHLVVGSSEYTNSDYVSLFPSAAGAHEMYITNDASCNSSGTWRPYQNTVNNWKLGQANDVATVYVKFKDSNGFISECVSDSITHDSVPPSGSFMINNGAQATLSNEVSLKFMSSDAKEMLITDSSDCTESDIHKWIAFTEEMPLPLLATNGETKTFYVKYRDQAANESVCLNSAITKINRSPHASEGERISLGMYYSCAISQSNELKCWGNNSYGQLGHESSMSPIGSQVNQMGAYLQASVISDKQIYKISTGKTHSCAILSDGKVKCWGNNTSGQLGIGQNINNIGRYLGDITSQAPVDLGSSSALQISLPKFGEFSCALLANGQVKCWGGNTNGQLGQGHKINIGQNSSELGDALSAIDLGSGVTAKQVSTGTNHACVITNEDKVKCWGGNQYGQLGLGDTIERGGESQQMGDNLPYVPLSGSNKVLFITSGHDFNCALLDNGQVKCWGDGFFGKLANGGTSNIGSSGNQVENIQALNFGNGLIALEISSGYQHSCAVLNDGSVKCWGWGRYGQLGLESTESIGDQASELVNGIESVKLGSNEKVKSIASGYAHSCAILENHSIKCWGRNNYGQLGHEDTQDKGKEAGQMGSSLPDTLIE